MNSCPTLSSKTMDLGIIVCETKSEQRLSRSKWPFFSFSLDQRLEIWEKMVRILKMAGGNV